MIKRVPIEPWSTWEKLCLANAVIKAGDQNWNAVSRNVKIIYEDSMQILGHEIRPPHWFSVKQCAAQYELLIARVVPKRKKRDRSSESADPVHRDAIFNTLKNEYFEELEKRKEEDRLEYAKILKKRDDILAGVYDDILDEMWAEELKEKDKDIKLKLKYKLGEKNAERNLSPIKTFTPLPEPGSGPIVSTPPPTSSTSPLLTSLLQSPSQHTLPSSPSISLLLNSTPSIPTNESPTLTKLLESPSSKVPGTAQEARPRPSDLPRHPVLLSPPKPLPPAPAPIPREEKIELKPEPVPEIKKGPISPPKIVVNEKLNEITVKPEKEVINPVIVVKAEESEEEVPAKKMKLGFQLQQPDLGFDGEVEDFMQRLTVAIKEAVGTNEVTELEVEKDIKPMEVEVEQEEVSKSPQAKTSDDEKEQTEEMDEVTTGDDTSKDVPEEAAASASSNDVPPVKAAPTDEFNTTDDEPDDPVQIEHNDHEAVEIIMGSNSNSVINVLAQDSSSEDITQSCEESKEHSAPAVTDEESKPEPDDTSDQNQKEEKSEADDLPVIEIDEDSVSKSPSKKTEEEDDEVEVPTATEDTSSSEPVEPEPEKKMLTPPSTPVKESLTTNTPLKEVSVTLEAIDIETCRSGEKASKEEIKAIQSEKPKRNRKKSSNIDSKPSSPASSFNEDEKEYRAWKKSVLLVYSRIASHKYASVFSKPITDAAGYGNWILEPMDLSTIKKNIESGIIRTTMEFQRDVLLMIQNAVIYNAENSLIHNMAKEMWSDVINEMNVMVLALGDGVPLGASGEGETAAPTRSGRQAKLSVEKKTTPAGTSKRQSRNRL